jgi:hypothetical protein
VCTYHPTDEDTLLMTVIGGRSVSTADVSKSAWYRLAGIQSRFVIDA